MSGGICIGRIFILEIIVQIVATHSQNLTLPACTSLSRRERQVNKDLLGNNSTLFKFLFISSRPMYVVTALLLKPLISSSAHVWQEFQKSPFFPDLNRFYFSDFEIYVWHAVGNPIFKSFKRPYNDYTWYDNYM